MDVAAWKAWYRGGKSFCCHSDIFHASTWESMPEEGVLGIVVVFDEISPGTDVQLRRMVSGSDLYWACEINGHWTICQGAHDDKPARRYPGASIKKGVWTSDEEMQRVNHEMRDWIG